MAQVTLCGGLGYLYLFGSTVHTGVSPLCVLLSSLGFLSCKPYFRLALVLTAGHSGIIPSSKFGGRHHWHLASGEWAIGRICTYWLRQFHTGAQLQSGRLSDPYRVLISLTRRCCPSQKGNSELTLEFYCQSHRLRQGAILLNKYDGRMANKRWKRQRQRQRQK